MKELLEEIARALVDHPEDVRVAAMEGEQSTLFELRVHPDDVGKVIGRQGRIAKAMRVLLGAAGMKLRKRFALEILEDSASLPPVREAPAGVRDGTMRRTGTGPPGPRQGEPGGLSRP